MPPWPERGGPRALAPEQAHSLAAGAGTQVVRQRPRVLLGECMGTNMGVRRVGGGGTNNGAAANGSGKLCSSGAIANARGVAAEPSLLQRLRDDLEALWEVRRYFSCCWLFARGNSLEPRWFGKRSHR